MPKTMTKPKTNKAEPQKIAAAKFVADTLADATVEILTLKQLVDTKLNARKTARTQGHIEGIANSIEGTGLLQNLVVYRMANGFYGVAAGETRRLALNLLMEQGRSAAGVPVTPDFPIFVKVVDEDKARAISYAENGQRSNLTPADQLENFRDMAKDGTSVEQIAAILGYRTVHVRKCLKLTTVAPSLQELLKTDQITLDQLAALGASDDHQRQIQAWENGRYYEHLRKPKALRDAVLNGEISAVGSELVDFVGLDVYQSAGGEIREDLFGESVILTNPLQLESMAIAKLQEAADAIVKKEGWAWGIGRCREARRYTDDEKTFEIPCVTTRLTSGQQTEMDQLIAEQKLLDDMLDETGLDADEEWEHAPRVEQIEARINEIYAVAELNNWPSEVRATAGIIAYLKDGQIQIQRGLMKVEDIKQQEKANREEIKKNTPPSEKGLSQVLVTSLSAERTLAVSAALAQNTNVAIALHTFTLARRVFDAGYFYVLHTSVESMRSGCLSQSEEAGSASGIANLKLNEMHESWLNQFPENWSESFEWLLAWPQGDVLELLAYCISHGLDGRDSYLKDKRVGTKLDSIEKALDFQIGEWWKPTTANFFSRISKDQIVDVLYSAGESGKAKDAEGMKRKDAAEFAAAVLSETGWLPNCMAPQPQAESENRADATTSSANANDTDADDSAAA
ncbi:TPA: ParB/RepB/Spo0J family partition protein [Serratia marcescens]